MEFSGLKDFIQGFLFSSKGHLYDVSLSYKEVTIELKGEVIATVQIKESDYAVRLTRRVSRAVGDYYNK